MRKAIAVLTVSCVLSITLTGQQIQQMVHVVSIQNEDRCGLINARTCEAGERPTLNATVLNVKIGSFLYVLVSTDSRQPEVGKDYEVAKISKDRVDLMIPGKKRVDTIGYTIRSKSEVPDSK